VGKGRHWGCHSPRLSHRTLQGTYRMATISGRISASFAHDVAPRMNCAEDDAVISMLQTDWGGEASPVTRTPRASKKRTPSSTSTGHSPARSSLPSTDWPSHDAEHQPRWPDGWTDGVRRGGVAFERARGTATWSPAILRSWRSTDTACWTGGPHQPPRWHDTHRDLADGAVFELMTTSDGDRSSHLYSIHPNEFRDKQPQPRRNE
jgi:hypothetical protein